MYLIFIIKIHVYESNIFIGLLGNILIAKKNAMSSQRLYALPLMTLINL